MRWFKNRRTEPTPPTNPIADRLDEVVAFIEEHGWTQGSWYESHTGKVCVEGALQAVSGMVPDSQKGGLIGQPDDLYVPALRALNNCVKEDTDGRFESALAFNDARGRTEDELLDTVRRCADRNRNLSAEQAEVSS